MGFEATTFCNIGASALPCQFPIKPHGSKANCELNIQMMSVE